MRNLLWVGLFLALALLGCSDHHGAVAAPRTHVARTGGSAVALSADERVAVVCNRSAGVVSVVALNPENGASSAIVTGKVEFDTGAGSEPWAAVVGLDDDTAYVVFRSSQRVGKLVSIHEKPTFEASVSVGSEPSAIAISPSGDKLFVANWSEGTISVITTRDFVQQVKIDLNPVLVATGVLGAVEPRLALAHPRALAVTDSGDENDSDETLYATEFFSQTLGDVAELGDLTQVDRNRQGFVYSISLKTGQPGEAISIAPVFDTGFKDGEGHVTGCFPNQLSAAAVDHGKLFVTSMCTSPRGPLGSSTSADSALANANYKTMLHPAVFVIDTSTNQELPPKGRLLTQVLDSYYQAGEVDADDLMPLSPSDIAFTGASAAGSSAYLSALGADALYRLDYDSTGDLTQIGSPGARFIYVKSLHGLPSGVAVSRASNPAFALSVSDTTQKLAVVDLAKQSVVDQNPVPLVDTIAVGRATVFKSSEENRGHGFFGTGRDIWSLKGQAWSSCEGCHPGGLSDGVTWFFARGPRRTLSTASTYDKLDDVEARSKRLMLWGANIDEVHDVEAIVRNVSGGVGAVLWDYGGDPARATADCRLIYTGTYNPKSSPPAPKREDPCLAWKPTTLLANGLNGALSDLDNGQGCGPEASECDGNSLQDWHFIDSFIRTERAPRAPTPLSVDDADSFQSDINAGHDLFAKGKCAGCHGGSGWTESRLFYEPGPAQNGVLSSAGPASDVLQLGSLREQRYSVPPEYLALNPAAAEGKGSATFRNSAAPGLARADLIDYTYNGAGSNQTDDQIRCVLRDVGTFPMQGKEPNNTGIVPKGAPSVFEYRSDMHSLAQGQSGFNVPSLFGLSVGAPYFHAGNARTLEEVFDSPTFERHHQALSVNFLGDATLRKRQIAELVAYLLSIDETTPIETSPIVDFCR
jgi:hypothetical protein